MFPTEWQRDNCKSVVANPWLPTKFGFRLITSYSVESLGSLSKLTIITKDCFPSSVYVKYSIKSEKEAETEDPFFLISFIGRHRVVSAV